MIQTENALGQVATVTFLDPEGSSKVNKSEEHDVMRGLRTTYVYDFLNRETSRTVRLEGAGSSGEVYQTVTQYEDAAHSMTVRDPRGFSTSMRLDGLDHVVEQVVDPAGLGLTTRTSYDGLGNRKRVLDPERHTTQYDFDGLGRLRRVVDARGLATAYEYDGEGLKTRETDRRGVRKDFTYDNLGRPRKVILAPAISSVPWSQEIRYQDVARKRREIDARLKETVSELDGLDRVVKVTDPYGFSARLRYDGVNKRAETNKRGHTTTFDYDALNRLIRVTDPAPFAGADGRDDVRRCGQRPDREGPPRDRQGHPDGLAGPRPQRDAGGRAPGDERVRREQQSHAHARRREQADRVHVRRGQPAELARGRRRLSGDGHHHVPVRQGRPAVGGARRARGR